MYHGYVYHECLTFTGGLHGLARGLAHGRRFRRDQRQLVRAQLLQPQTQPIKFVVRPTHVFGVELFVLPWTLARQSLKDPGKFTFVQFHRLQRRLGPFPKHPFLVLVVVLPIVVVVPLVLEPLLRLFRAAPRGPA
jgi:hypothetical protein